MTELTQEQKQLIEQAAVSTAQFNYRTKMEAFVRGFNVGAEHVIIHSEDFGLFSQQGFLKEPVTFLLVNAMRLPQDQVIALRDALIERTQGEMFSRERVIELIAQYHRNTSGGLEREDHIILTKAEAEKWVNNKLNTTNNDQSAAGTDKA